MESADIVVTRLLRPSGRRSWSCCPRLPPGSGRHPRCVRGWSVKDVALHLLGDDIDLLSRRRDGAAPTDTPGRPAGFQELVASLDRLNQSWVEATRRSSTGLLCELLAVTGEATGRYLTSLELFAVEEPVSWVRPDPVPNWLDVARQYTERWTHQQQIRDAVGMPGLEEPASWRRCWPPCACAARAFTDVPAAVGTTVEVVIAGEAGGCWVLTRTPRS